MLLDIQEDLAEQLLSVMEKRRSRERIMWVCILIIFICISVYLARKAYIDSSIVALPQKQAETVQGVQKAAELAHTPLLSSQTEEVATKIKAAKEKTPDQIVVANGEVATEIAKIAKEKRADLTIVTTQPALLDEKDKTQLNIYNIKAYPQQMFEIGIGRYGKELAYLHRVDAPRIPLLLSKGSVGYIGPYIRVDKERFDYGFKVLVPL